MFLVEDLVSPGILPPRSVSDRVLKGPVSPQTLPSANVSRGKSREAREGSREEARDDSMEACLSGNSSSGECPVRSGVSGDSSVGGCFP